MPVKTKTKKAVAKKAVKKGSKKKSLGKLIVIDGTDGSGKATQTALLVERLLKLGVKVKKTDFPRYDTNFFGKLIKQCLAKEYGDFLAIHPKIASVLYAADRFEESTNIRSWLEDGYVVIADRYVSANQIHQGGKIHHEDIRREFLEWLDEMEHEVFGIPRPTTIVYLHVPVHISRQLIIERAKANNTSPDQAESDADHLLASQESALKIIQKLNSWIKIDCAHEQGMRSREDIHEEVFKKIKKLIGI